MAETGGIRLCLAGSCLQWMAELTAAAQVTIGLCTQNVGPLQEGAGIFKAPRSRRHTPETRSGIFHAQRPEEWAAVERAEIAGMEYAGVEDKVAVKCQGGVSPKSDSGIKRPQVAALLQRSQYTGFGMGCGDAAMPSAGVFPSETGRSVGNGLYTHIGGILFTAAVLYEDVDRKVQCMCGSGACRMFAQRGLLCPSYGESFLMG